MMPAQPNPSGGLNLGAPSSCQTGTIGNMLHSLPKGYSQMGWQWVIWQWHGRAVLVLAMWDIAGTPRDQEHTTTPKKYWGRLNTSSWAILAEKLFFSWSGKQAIACIWNPRTSKCGQNLVLAGFSTLCKWEVILSCKAIFFERFQWIYYKSILWTVMGTLGSIAALFTVTPSIILWNIWTWLSILIGKTTLFNAETYL